ncbi:MAG: ACT domain-containing protein, partial [Proteobacteria bacterium]|nr:ACT domain-containing protein [Pseudomonadota bacterium]
LAKHDISYISKATNANTIGMIINDRDCRPEMIAELQDRFEQITLQKVAIVCAIGSNIGQPGIMAKAASALATDGINILAVSQTARQTNMQFVVERSQFAKAQVALHKALCMTGPRACAG